MKVFAKLVREGTDASGAYGLFAVKTIALDVDATDTVFSCKMRLRHHLRQLEDAAPPDTESLMAAVSSIPCARRHNIRCRTCRTFARLLFR